MRCHQHKIEFAWNEKCPICAGTSQQQAEPPRRPKESDFPALCRLLRESGYEGVVILPDQPESVRAALGASLEVLYLTDHGILSPSGLDPGGMSLVIVIYENDQPTIRRVLESMAGAKANRLEIIAINRREGGGNVKVAPKDKPKRPVTDMGRFWPRQWEHNGDNSADVTIATAHFNWSDSQHSINKYFKWRPTLGNLKDKLDTREACADGRGFMTDAVWHSSPDKIWVKESLLNCALVSSDAEYFAWIDNDIIICDNEWLPKAIEKLKHCAAVQLFGQVRFLDRENNVIQVNKGAAWNWKNNRNRHGSPGGAWIARRSTLLNMAGLPDYCPVGSTDQDFFNAVSGAECSEHADWCGEAYSKMSRAWMERASRSAAGMGVDCLECDAAHIWHGDRENRQYVERAKVLDKHNFDPLVHLVRHSIDGMPSWTDDAPKALRADVEKYFVDRREDG